MSTMQYTHHPKTSDATQRVFSNLSSQTAEILHSLSLSDFLSPLHPPGVHAPVLLSPFHGSEEEITVI